MLEDNVYQVSWQLDEPNNKITLDLSGRVALNEYMAFGISGSDTRTLMVGSDVTVAWIDPSTNGALADDYYLSAYSQVSEQDFDTRLDFHNAFQVDSVLTYPTLLTFVISMCLKLQEANPPLLKEFPTNKKS